VGVGLLSEAAANRELLRNLILRELKASYRGSVLGALWSLLNPLINMAIFILVFGLVLRVPVPMTNRGTSSFAAFLLVGMLPWNFLSVSLSAGAISLVANSSLIRKVYFFRPLLPVTAVLANGINFLVAMALLILWLGFSGFDLRVLWLLPVPALSLLLLSLGLAFVTATANVYFRDTQYLLSLLSTAWFYLTPIIYPLELVRGLGETWYTLFRLNPAAAIVSSFRAILYEGRVPSAFDLLWSLGSGMAFFLAGWKWFRHAEPHFAEEV
jgi:ABC-2 type transport system permease protein